jgi:hypothetical protein
VRRVLLVKNHALKVFLAGLFLVLAAGFLLPHVVQAWRGSQVTVLRRHYLGWQAMDSTYFNIRFTECDSDLMPLIAHEADLIVERVSELLPHEKKSDKPWLVISPNQHTLKEAFGWGDGPGALGVYMADTITVLSPRAWVWVRAKKRLEVFWEEGPLAHEYTHYVLDLRTNGNYPYWFSEGLAQLVEYKLNNYEWVEEDSSLDRRSYSLEELDAGFPALCSQALAYRQALSLVTYLEFLQGMDGLNLLIDALGRGRPFYRALADIYSLDKESLEAGWQDWFRQDQRWFLTP